MVSEGPGHLVTLAEQAVAEGATRIIAVGGDGTVHEVVNGILKAGNRDVELGVLPFGTGRDFARSLGLPKRFDRALDTALFGGVQEVDLGRATYAGGDAWFANFAGAGISGAIARRANRSSKLLGGRVAFLVSTVWVFAGWKSARVEADVDGERRSGPMFELVAMNGPYAAGGMRIAPDARPDDGWLDCVIFGDVTKLDFLTTFPKIYSGRHLAHPKIELLRGRAVTIEADPPIPVVLDGEQAGTTPAHFEVVPGALRVRVPA
jgi:YegS/Rv2252/BmrU family lipid kinase